MKFNKELLYNIAKREEIMLLCIIKGKFNMNFTVYAHNKLLFD